MSVGKLKEVVENEKQEVIAVLASSYEVIQRAIDGNITPEPATPPGPANPGPVPEIPGTTHPQPDTPSTDSDWPNTWYVDGGTAAAEVAKDRAAGYTDISKEDVDAVEKVLAKDAQSIWINSAQDVANIFPKMKDAAAKGEVMQLVAYNIPNRDGNNPDSWSAGGANGVADYKSFIDLLAHNLAAADVYAYVIIEPDAVVQPNELEPKRVECLNYAMAKLASVRRVRAHIDAGGANWRSPDEMITRLKKLTWPSADVGLTTNVSGYHGITATLEYINPIAKALNKLFIVDTSRNGIDEKADGWCNLWGKKQGAPAQLIDDRYQDDGDPAEVHAAVHILKLRNPWLGAFMHIKRAGESDGMCGGGPSAGAWFRWWAVDFALRTLGKKA